MSRFNKIYVLAPYGHATGGVELAHQLVDYLRNHGSDAYIVYVDKDSFEISTKQDVTLSYNKYNIKTTDSIQDLQNNMLVISEIYCDYIFKYKKINVGCWWMSVDFHYYYCCFKDAFNFRKTFVGKLRKIGKLLQGIPFRNSIKDIRDEGDRIVHFYQSVYAQQHLYSCGFSQVLPLGDYINDSLIPSEINKDRENLVLYNPAKGFTFTKKIIDKYPNIKFIALKGLTRDQLSELMQKAKVYIDFGNFPGKDRLPREAVLNGCCIITGRTGASGFYEDVAIPDKYKFIDSTENIHAIGMIITDIFSDFESHFEAFNIYRQRILNEKNRFYSEIEQAFL